MPTIENTVPVCSDTGNPAEPPECKWCDPHTRVKCPGCGLFKSFMGDAAEPVCPDPDADTEEHVRECPSAAWLREQLRLVGEQAMKALEDESEWKRRALAAEQQVLELKALVQTLTDELAEHEGSMYDEPAPAGCVD